MVWGSCAKYSIRDVGFLMPELYIMLYYNIHQNPVIITETLLLWTYVG